MLDKRQSFKFGFLLRCADEGLTPEQTDHRVKQAHVQLGLVKQGFDPAGWAAKLALLGIGGSALAGATVGAGVATTLDRPADVESVKRQELIAAYQQQADRIRQATAARKYRETPKVPRTASF